MSHDTLRMTARVRKVGSSMAILIPAREARRAGLREGSVVEVSIKPKVPEPLGLLKDLPYKPFIRAKEGLWRDRP